MKKSATNFPITGLIAALVLGLFLSGCENNPTEPQPDPPSNQLQLSDRAKSVTVGGWQITNSLNTQDQFSELVSGGSQITDEEGMLNSMAEIRREEKTMKRIYTFAEKSGSFSKITGDSLIWYEEWSLGGTSGRRALYYNEETQTARFYEVIFQFPQLVRLEYDSTQFMVFVGPSLADSSDDRLLSINKLSLFKANYFVEKVESFIEVTDWDEQNQVIGATASNTVWYGDQTQLLKLQQNAEINPDASGFISERLDYRDNTFREVQVNFYDNFTGDFAETWRNGTTVSGTSVSSILPIISTWIKSSRARNIPLIPRIPAASPF
jgi:hypothetical protein